MDSVALRFSVQRKCWIWWHRWSSVAALTRVAVKSMLESAARKPLRALRIIPAANGCVHSGPFTFLWFLFLVYFWLVFINRPLVSCPSKFLTKESLQKRSGGCHFDREPASEDRTNCLIVRDIEILRSAQDDRPLPKKLLKESLGHDTSRSYYLFFTTCIVCRF